MDFNAASILTLFIGLVLGGGTIYAIIILTGAGAGKKAEKIINDAKKEADKAKRDSMLELKEESFKLKQETDREVKEKKQRFKVVRKDYFKGKSLWIREKNYYKIEIICLRLRIII